MKRAILLVASLMLISTVASAGPNWQALTLSITPENLPTVLTALDELMTKIEPGDTGSAALMVSVAGGDSSHVFISSFESRAAREAWSAKLNPSKAWTKYSKTTAGLIERGGSSRMDVVKSWGDESNKDVFWEIFSFTVTDPAALSAALDTFLASDTGKKFPGQVHLSAIAAAGPSASTHVISVGFESEAEAEAWGDSLSTSEDWTSYQKATGGVSSFTGAYMIRSIATWGDSDE